MERLTRYSAIISLLLVAVALRIRGISELSFDLDEMATGAWVYAPSLSDLYSQVRNPFEGNAFGYPVLIWLWGFFSKEPSWLRLFSVIAGVSAIFVFYFASSKAWGRGVAWAAALLLSVNNLFLLQSQNARVYALYALMVFCAFLSFRKALQEPEKKKWLALYVFFSVFCLYLHHVAFFYLFVLWCWAGWEFYRGRVGRAQLWAPVIVGVFYLPQLHLLLYQLQHGPGWISSITAHSFLAQVLALLWMRHWVPTFGVFFLMVVGLVSVFKKKGFLEICFLFSPILLGALFSTVVREMFVERYFLPTVISLFFFTGEGLAQIWRGGNRGRVALCLLLALMAFFVWRGFEGFYDRARGENFKGAAAFILENREKCGDVVITSPLLIRRWPVYLRPPIELKVWGGGVGQGAFWILNSSYPVPDYILAVAKNEPLLLFEEGSTFAACVKE